MNPKEQLDEDRIDALTGQLLIAIRENYLKGPVSRDRVYEALNALAFSTSWVIRGCNDPIGGYFDPEALEWFCKALNMNLK